MLETIWYLSGLAIQIALSYLAISVTFMIVWRVYLCTARMARRICQSRPVVRTSVGLANFVGAKIDDGVCLYCLENQKSVMLRPCNHM